MLRSRKRLIVAGASAPIEIDAPGLRIIERPNGAQAYWVPSREAKRRYYTPRTVRLDYDPSDPASFERMAARCRHLQAEMLDWLRDPERSRRLIFDGSLESLIRIYQRHPDSPYAALRSNTRRCYDEWCKVLSECCGTRRIDKVDGPTLRKWYRGIRMPDGHTGPPRERLAVGCVRQMMRILVNFGMELGLEPCFRLSQILSVTQLRPPRDENLPAARRRPKERQAMTYEHARAIVETGLARNTVRHRSVALGVAAQFEFGLSQIDVIGYWEKVNPARPVHPGEIVDRGQVWFPGLCYEDFRSNVLETARSKTAIPGSFDVTLAPLFTLAVASVPETERAGPLAVDAHGIPLRRRLYAALFRELANAANVPEAVKSMHARHGAASEADDAGVDHDDIAGLLQHAGPRVTRAHYLKGSLERSRRAQMKRLAHRERKESA